MSNDSSRQFYDEQGKLFDFLNKSLSSYAQKYDAFLSSQHQKTSAFLKSVTDAHTDALQQSTASAVSNMHAMLDSVHAKSQAIAAGLPAGPGGSSAPAPTP